MAGMLSQANAPPTPSPGPDTQTPPTAGAVPSANLPRDGAPEPGQLPVNTQELKDQAIQLVYGERFDQMIKMFESNGAEKFPRSVAVVINTAIGELEKKGPVAPEVAAEIGMELILKLMDDIYSYKVLPNLTLEQMREALPATLVMYADSHPDVSKEDVQTLVQEVQRGVAEKGGGQEPAPEQQQMPTGGV